MQFYASSNRNACATLKRVHVLTQLAGAATQADFNSAISRVCELRTTSKRVEPNVIPASKKTRIGTIVEVTQLLLCVVPSRCWLQSG